MTGSWLLVDERGTAADLHAASADALNAKPAQREVRVLRATRPALVLGSSQDLAVFDSSAIERAGLEVARRRSGGSAVLVGPAEVLWVDFVVPAGDPLWDDDVGRAAWWAGEAWAAALTKAGISAPSGPAATARAEVWEGPMRRTPWSDLICYAGLGPGEVTIAGRKVVGISQRRKAHAALLQTAALLRWDPSDYTSLLKEMPASADPAELADTAVGIGPEREQALLSALLEDFSLRMP